MVDQRRYHFVALLFLLSKGFVTARRSQAPFPDHPLSFNDPINLLAFPFSSSNDELASPPSAFAPPPSLPLTDSVPKRKRKAGRLTIDLKGTSVVLFPNQQQRGVEDKVGNEMGREVMTDASIAEQQPNDENMVRLTMGPTSAYRLAKLGVVVSGPFTGAFMSTLRLLAPLILSRRILNAAGDLVYDYMRGRYIRKTYTRLENMYIRFYELPAAFRAISRTTAQVVILLVLCSVAGKVMATIPGIKSPYGGCWWAGILLASGTVGSGHLCTSALATWGGPLRIQVNANHSSTRRMTRIFTRPWHILQWMTDPEAWITTMAARPAQKPFLADPILFPATWAPLRLLQMIGVAGVLAKPKVMGEYLLQVSFADEWYRTFVSERRVGLGLCVAIAYLISTVSLVFTVATADVSSSIFLVPHLLATIVSSWMNLIIFWERLEVKRREALLERSHAALRAFGY